MSEVLFTLICFQPVSSPESGPLCKLRPIFSGKTISSESDYYRYRIPVFGASDPPPPPSSTRTPPNSQQFVSPTAAACPIPNFLCTHPNDLEGRWVKHRNAQLVIGGRNTWSPQFTHDLAPPPPGDMIENGWILLIKVDENVSKIDHWVY